MTTTQRTQLRGHCQCCGRQQAVPNGRMSKHGYEVKNGWFNGICQGEKYEPIEKDRTVADSIVEAVRKECVELRAKAAALTAGTITPPKAKSGRRIKNDDPKGFPWVDEMVPFAEAPAHFQQQAVDAAAWNAEGRARQGESFADGLERIANEYHGKDLLVVVPPAAPEPIQIGEQRRTHGRAVTVTDVHAGRVYWKDERGFKGWTGTQSFRKFAKVEG